MSGRSNIRSAAKSIVAILVGIALKDGLISSLDQTLGELLPKKLVNNFAPEKRNISLHHLLTMTSGLESMESGINALKFLSSPDWTRFMLRLKSVSRPGERFIYNSANPHLISAVISHLSGETLLAYAKRKLFEPLGIRNVAWGAGPESTTFGGGNLFLSAEELLRIGELCLARGRVNGKQLIPETWIDEMWKPYEEFLPGWKYGFYWYLHDEIDSSSGRRFITYSAAGTGGQKLLLIPEIDLAMAVVATTDFLGERGIALNKVISTELIPAVNIRNRYIIK